MHNQDEKLLGSLNGKIRSIRDRVISVALGSQTGLFLHGPGGTGKSHEIRSALDGMGANWLLTNSRLTPKALFELLRDYSDTVHVLEDCETMLADKQAAGVLRSCLWGPMNARGLMERVVCWNVSKDPQRFIFRGGVIIVANRPLGQVPELAAVASRIDVVEYRPTVPEMAAQMRAIAAQGHRDPATDSWLPPELCLECVAEIIARSQGKRLPLDLRQMVKTFSDRILDLQGHFSNSWKDHLENRLNGCVESPIEPKSAKDEAIDVELMKELAKLPPSERVEAWKKRGGSRATFYRKWKDYLDQQGRDSMSA